MKKADQMVGFFVLKRQGDQSRLPPKMPRMDSRLTNTL